LPMTRGRLDIFAQILEMAIGGTTKTRLISQANLNHRVTTLSLNLLVDLDLLSETHHSPTSYGVTEKGLRFLHEYRNLQTLLNPEKQL